jgi:hypothetical protein
MQARYPGDGERAQRWCEFLPQHEQRAPGGVQNSGRNSYNMGTLAELCHLQNASVCLAALCLSPAGWLTLRHL